MFFPPFIYFAATFFLYQIVQIFPLQILVESAVQAAAVYAQPVVNYE